MNYAGFRAHLSNFLWKPNDVILMSYLGNLIRMADALLNRELKVQNRQTAVELTLNDVDVSLPSNFFSLRSIECNDEALAIRDFSYVNPAEMYGLRRKHKNREWLPYYSLRGATVMFSGPGAAAPTTAIAIYNATVPDFQSEDTSWLADKYLDLYTYAALKHAALFIREDERMPLWNSEYERALDSANSNAEWYQKRGPSASMRLPRNPNATRRR